MRAPTLTSIAVVLGLAVVGNANAVDGAVAEYRDTLDRYCVTCHNEKLHMADLTLDLADVDDVSAAPHIWEKVISKLSLKAMPPVGMPRPDADFYSQFSSYLQTNLDAAAVIAPNPGRTVTAHRLNRHEYANVVKDLLGVEVDVVALLPADNSGGFDNLGGSVIGIGSSDGKVHVGGAQSQSAGSRCHGHSCRRKTIHDRSAAASERAHERRLAVRFAWRGRCSSPLPAGRRLRD